jgi:hypothetical protein
MSPEKLPSKAISCSPNLTLPEPEQSKDTVLNVQASAHSRRSYNTRSTSSFPGIALSHGWDLTDP